MKKVLNVLVDFLIFILFFSIIVSFYVVATSKEGKASPFLTYRVFINKVDNMAPAIEYGDMVVGKIVDPKDLKEDDIIIYYDEDLKASYSTRIKTINADGTMIVDSDNISNEQKIKPESIDGKFIYRLHFVGLVLSFFVTPRGTIVLILSVVLLIVIGLILTILKNDKKKKNKKEE